MLTRVQEYMLCYAFFTMQAFTAELYLVLVLGNEFLTRTERIIVEEVFLTSCLDSQQRAPDDSPRPVDHTQRQYSLQ
jgi:hypothetical protein